VTGIFKANNSYNNFLLFFYGLILKIPGLFVHPEVPVPQEMDGNMFRKFIFWLEPAGTYFPWLYSLIAFVLVYTQAILLNNFAVKYKLMQTPSYLVGMSYLLITSLFPEWQTLSSPVIVNTFIVLVLYLLSGLFTAPNPKSVLFNIGLLIGLASFFYFPSISFLLLLIVGLMITRPFRLNEWIIGLLGVVTPYYFLSAYLFLTDKWSNYKLPTISVVTPFFKDSRWSYVAILMLSILIITGYFFVRMNLRRQLVQTRKIWGIVTLYFVIAFIVPFINVNDRFDYWILMAVPAACFAGAAFLYPQRKWFSLVFHWGLVALSVIMGYFLNG
jgi:hypothetical protein